MAIKRIVVTEVYCDVCGEHVYGWEGDDVRVSKAWATYYAREKGCTVGKRVICKRCRIKERIRKCGLQYKIGSVGCDDNGLCMGIKERVSDELMDECKCCIACTPYRQKEGEHHEG